MADTEHKKTDEKLEEMEKRLSAIYSRAEKEIQETAEKYFAEFKKKDDEYQKLYNSGKMTKEEYKKWQHWRRSKVSYGKRFDAMKEQCAKQLLNVNKTALAYVYRCVLKKYYRFFSFVLLPLVNRCACDFIEFA